MSESILSGIRVIDCATYIAAPAAATVMADFGADVVKIERPPHGDPYRYLSKLPAMPQSDELYCWTLDGRNRKSLALNLQIPASRDVLLKLVARADVFITNYQPQMLARLRLAYEDLQPLNERLIYAQVTGFGETGPDADKPGYDSTAYWARSGLMGLVHYANSDPIVSPAGLGDHPTAMSLFGGIMLALYRRQISGRGSKVSTSLLANGAWANGCNVQAALSGARFVPRRTRATSLVPLVNHYVTRDGQRFILCCLNPPREWPLICEAIGLRELIDDPRFGSAEGRRENAAALIAILDRAIAERDLAK